MPEVHVAEYQDTVVLHFGTQSSRINAYTLASALAGIADAARAANAAVNPGYDLEVVVEALGGGSFRAHIRTIYRGAQDLFSASTLKSIVIGVITSFVYQHTLAPDREVNVRILTNEVLIEQGDTKVVVPRQVYDAAREIERSPQFRQGVTQVIRSVEADPEIKSLGLGRSAEETAPSLQIPRERFSVLPAYLAGEALSDRELVETTDVEILRAILERSKRRWEFVWNGMRISAPVSDNGFYDDFIAHRIKIAPGDALRVRLRIRQRKARDVEVFINESYEVVEVLAHMPKVRQGGLPLDASEDQ